MMFEQVFVSHNPRGTNIGEHISRDENKYIEREYNSFLNSYMFFQKHSNHHQQILAVLVECQKYLLTVLGNLVRSESSYTT